jgi:hypothetical protein
MFVEEIIHNLLVVREDLGHGTMVLGLSEKGGKTERRAKKKREMSRACGMVTSKQQKYGGRGIAYK